MLAPIQNQSPSDSGMGSELQNIPPDAIRPVRPKSADDATTTKDDRPLLKPGTNSAAPEVHTPPPPSPSMEELEKKYAPFVRHDVYGIMGRGELPRKEKLLLAIGLVTLLPLRVVAATTILVVYYLICRVCTAFLAPNRQDEQEDYAHMGGWRRKVIAQSGRFCSRAMLFAFGFYWIRKTHRNNDINGKLNNEVLQCYSVLFLNQFLDYMF